MPLFSDENKSYVSKSLDITVCLLGMKSLTAPASGQQKVNAVIWNLEGGYETPQCTCQSRSLWSPCEMPLPGTSCLWK